MHDMDQHFTHLHLHTDFSLLDGAISIDKLIDFGKQHHFKALALTDHGNIFGAVKFFEKCKKAGIKPILGIEAYFTEDVSIKQADKKYYHLILLVENAIGYKNLCKLISFSYQKGFYFKPRIDYSILKQYSEGLIVLSGCLGGHIPQLLINQQEESAHTYINWFLDTFGTERFYFEVQPDEQNEQKILNEKLFKLSKQYNIKTVATGDCHYVSPEDRYAHEVMLAIQTHDKMDNPERYTFGDCRVHIRTTEQMLAVFPEHPEAIWTAGEIADRCSFQFETGKLFFPQFAIPPTDTPDTFFKKLCIKGFDTLLEKKRFDLEKKDEYYARLELEMNLIISMGFVGYFLVVSDFIQWARRNHIPVGPGRGSAAGSLVAWALEITNIDPLKYNLLFERFLNPERISMPDIDIDFCIEGREAVINYVRDKYGHDKVCQIITFGTMMAKGVIKDAARALGLSFEDSNEITSLIGDQLKITLKEAIEQEPRLQELLKHNLTVQKLFDIAFRLEGLTRHASKHAAGIVISPEAVDEVLPVYVPPKSTELVTQYAMTELELLGFLKIDLLGLKNLTLINHTLSLIAKNWNITIDIDMIPLDDPKTFALLSEGNTTGVFQLESDGLKEVLRKLQPDKFEDIIAVNALYRPGPLGSGMVDDYIERRHGRQKITYLFPELESILKETYGVIVYQEQVMKIASAIAGYTLGQSDILRRAMGKKKPEVMAEQKKLFLAGATQKQFDEQRAGELFDLMAYFAGYGFNKSHSAAYGLIAYQTAYLKANFSNEFMACLISLEAHHAENMAFYLQEARTMGITILPPDINHSLIEFSVIDNTLLFGLQGIKNVGLAALNTIMTERNKGLYKDLLDFCYRVDLRTVNKRVIESLICAGAFDSLPGSRAQKYTELSTIMDQALERKKAEQTGQMGLFSMHTQSPTEKGESILYAFQSSATWTTKETLEKEQDAIGFYISAHPLETYAQQINWFCPTPIQKIISLASGNTEYSVFCCGLLKNKREIITKKGDRMGFLQIEDQTGEAEIIVFPKLFSKVVALLEEYTIFFIKGTLDYSPDMQKCKIKAQELTPIELVFEQWPSIEKVSCTLKTPLDETKIKTLVQVFNTQGTTALEFIYHDHGKKLKLIPHKKITFNGQTALALAQNVHFNIIL